MPIDRTKTRWNGWGWIKAHNPVEGRDAVWPWIAEALGTKIRTVDRLAPGAAVADILAAAGWPDHKGAVVVVGHQPDLGSTVAHLMSGAGGDWSLKKGALAWLASRDKEPQVVLRAAISPDLL